MGKMKQQQLYLCLNICVQLFLNSTPPLPLRELETGERTLSWAGQVRIPELGG